MLSERQLNQGDVSPPNPPSLPPKKSKKVWWVMGGIVVLILLAVGLILVILPQHLAYAPDTQTSTTVPKTAPVVPGEPVDCLVGNGTCIPNVDVTRDVVPKLQAEGFTCEPNKSTEYVQDCKDVTTHQEVAFTNSTLNTEETDISSIHVIGDVSATGVNPPSQAQAAWTLNVDTFHKAIAAIFTSYPNIQKNMTNWIKGQTGTCNYPLISDYDLVDQYELRCDPIVPIAVSGSAGTVTTWTSLIDLTAPISLN